MVDMDINTLRAVSRLEMGSPELFHAFISWLKASHEDEHNIMENHRDEEIRELARGKAQCLTFIINEIEKANETLKRMNLRQ